MTQATTGIIRTFRVLFTATSTDQIVTFPLLNTDDEPNQEFCGWGYGSDFDLDDEQSEVYGEVYEFVTDQPDAMIAVLNNDSSVVAYTSRVGGLEI